MHTKQICALILSVAILMAMLPIMSCSTDEDVVTPPSQNGPNTGEVVGSSENGLIEIRRTLPNGRIVYLYVPDSVRKNPSVKVPLVLALHATSSTPQSVVYNCGWADKAVKENFVIVAPSYTSFNDTDFFSAAVEEAIKDYSIDTKRVYATGFSNGGASCLALCRDHPNLFAAIAPMGWMVEMRNVNGVYEAWDMPFQVIQGTREYTFATPSGAMSLMPEGQQALRALMLYNELISPSIQANYDYTPYWGYQPSDTKAITVSGDELHVSNFYKKGYAPPFGQLILVTGAGHRQHMYSATMAWEFLQNYARGENGSVITLTASEAGR